MSSLSQSPFGPLHSVADIILHEVRCVNNSSHLPFSHVLGLHQIAATRPCVCSASVELPTQNTLCFPRLYSLHLSTSPECHVMRPSSTGPVVGDGFGLGYIIKDEGMQICCTSFRCCDRVACCWTFVADAALLSGDRRGASS